MASVSSEVEVRVASVLDEDRRWYSVEEAVSLTAKAECPPSGPRSRLRWAEIGRLLGPEPQHLSKLTEAVRANRVQLLGWDRQPVVNHASVGLLDACISREDLRRFALTELGIWFGRPMGAEVSAARRASGLFTLHEVVGLLAEERRWLVSDGQQFQELTAIAMQDGTLHAYDEVTLLRCRPTKASAAYGFLLRSDEVDAWLAGQGVPYRPDWAGLLQSDNETAASVARLRPLRVPGQAALTDAGSPMSTAWLASEPLAKENTRSTNSGAGQADDESRPIVTLHPPSEHRQEPTAVERFVRHSTDDRRQDILTPMIRKAEELAGPGASAAQVWAQLQQMARSTPPPAPLSKVTSGGVVYFDGPRERTFTVRALRDRLRRARAR